MCGCKGAPVLTVGNDAAGVERMLEEGSLACPACGGRLARWGHGLERTVFGPRREGSAVRPRRSISNSPRVRELADGGLPTPIGPVPGRVKLAGCRRVALIFLQPP